MFVGIGALKAILARDRPMSSLFFWVALETPIQVPLVLAQLVYSQRADVS